VQMTEAPGVLVIKHHRVLISMCSQIWVKFMCESSIIEERIILDSGKSGTFLLGFTSTVVLGYSPWGIHGHILLSHNSRRHAISDCCPVWLSLLYIISTFPVKTLKLKFIYDRRSVGQSIMVSVSHLEPMNVFLFSVQQLRVSWCGAPYLAWGWACNIPIQLLWGFARPITLGFKSHRTHDHILLPHLRLPQLGGLGPRIYSHHEQGGPRILQGTRFPFRHLLLLVGHCVILYTDDYKSLLVNFLHLLYSAFTCLVAKLWPSSSHIVIPACRPSIYCLVVNCKNNAKLSVASILWVYLLLWMHVFLWFSLAMDTITVFLFFSHVGRHL
jgi:hypothetical protein